MAHLPVEHTLAAFLLALLTVVVITLSARYIIRGGLLHGDFVDIIRDKFDKPSLSLMQFFLWTVVISYAFIAVYFVRIFAGVYTPPVEEWPSNLLVLMGISSAVPIARSRISRGGERKPIFSWTNFRERESEKQNLRDFLVEELELEWAKEAEVNKSEKGTTITVVKGEKKLEITLSLKHTGRWNARMRIGEDKKGNPMFYEFTVREDENKNLKVYRAKMPFSSLLQEKGKATLPRFQMFTWTWIGIMIYLAILFSSVGEIQTTNTLETEGTTLDCKMVPKPAECVNLPDIDPALVVLMGLSQVTYLGMEAFTSKGKTDEEESKKKTKDSEGKT